MIATALISVAYKNIFFFIRFIHYFCIVFAIISKLLAVEYRTTFQKKYFKPLKF